MVAWRVNDLGQKDSSLAVVLPDGRGCNHATLSLRDPPKPAQGKAGRCERKEASNCAGRSDGGDGRAYRKFTVGVGCGSEPPACCAPTRRCAEACDRWHGCRVAQSLAGSGNGNGGILWTGGGGG